MKLTKRAVLIRIARKLCCSLTRLIILADEWTNIAVTYDSNKEVAIIYVDGDIKEGSVGAGALSEDWGGEASFGNHNSSATSFDWFDEIYMFDRELNPLEIRTLFMKCSYVLNSGEKHSQLAVAIACLGTRKLINKSNKAFL